LQGCQGSRGERRLPEPGSGHAAVVWRNRLAGEQEQGSRAAWKYMQPLFRRSHSSCPEATQVRGAAMESPAASGHR